MPLHVDDNSDYLDLRQDILAIRKANQRILEKLAQHGLLQPAAVAEMSDTAERLRLEFAWLHHCGHLNQGYWDKRSVCAGCRFSVEHTDEVDGHYRLVEVEGLTDQEQT